MARKPLYPEGIRRTSLSFPAPVWAALERIASREPVSVSRLVSRFCEDELRRRGELPRREEVPV